MAIPIEDIIQKYVELRDRCAELAKKQSEEMAPLSTAMEQIENYLLHQMNTLGVDSFKTGAGTAFKKNANSVQLQDPLTFKEFVFRPAVEGIVNYLCSTGYGIRDLDKEHMQNIVRDLPMWDMVDFRAGKKGVVEYVANENVPVPGVAINTTTTINIRRA